jgi:hypothetical protein
LLGREYVAGIVAAGGRAVVADIDRAAARRVAARSDQAIAVQVDVSDPAAPSLKWRKGCTDPSMLDTASCSTGMGQMGQSWSIPAVALIRGFTNAAGVEGGKDVPLVIMGGGYDTCEDTDDIDRTTACASPKGNKVFVLNANDGTLIKTFTTDRSVAADVTLIDRDFDQRADHAYVADTGGNLYRIDFIDPTTSRVHPLVGELLQRDSFNASIGADINRFVRWLNPTQTFFITTQFFYKHIFDSPGDLILPVPFRNTRVGNQIPVVGTKGDLNGVLKNVFGATVGCGTGTKGRRRPCPLQPRFLKLNDDRFLQTLLITTSYSGGRIVPLFGVFYDWQGAIVFQPGVQLVRDPFRFIFDYTRIEGAPTGQFGAVRDRDNVRFQAEYVF